MAEPAFFCEHCKKEVSATDKVCPRCGSFFTDVRCPKCGCSGEALQFRFGCPKCGYLNPVWYSQGASSPAFIEILNPAIFEGSPATVEHPPEKRLQPPPWFFLSITIALGTICAALLYVFIK
jgi:hypothetical protein